MPPLSYLPEYDGNRRFHTLRISFSDINKQPTYALLVNVSITTDYSRMLFMRNTTSTLKIAIIGYGSQGRAHALNLRDSGFDIIVGLLSRWTNRS